MAPQARGFMILRKVKPGASSHAMPVEDKTQDNLPDRGQCYIVISESYP